MYFCALSEVCILSAYYQSYCDTADQRAPFTCQVTLAPRFAIRAKGCKGQGPARPPIHPAPFALVRPPHMRLRRIPSLAPMTCRKGGKSSRVSRPSVREVSKTDGPKHDAQSGLPRADGHPAARHGGLPDVQDVRGVPRADPRHRGRRQRYGRGV